METKVVNLHREKIDWKDPNVVYIGRAGRGFSGYWGNPYNLRPGEDRGSTLDRFTLYARLRMDRDKVYRIALRGLHGKTLVCFCKPLACHGDVLAQLAEELFLGGE